MFRNILSRLFNDADDGPALSGQDAEVAIAALLIRVARADDRYTDVERAQIDRILGRRRGLRADEAAERRAAAELIEAEAPDTVRLTRTIKQRVLLDDRMAVISALWEVVYSDGGRGADEEAMVRLASGLLGINDRDSNLARQQVIADLGLTG